MNADRVYLDQDTGHVTAKKYGDSWVYWPTLHITGARHSQPGERAIQPLACFDFAPGFQAFFDHRGALDAPNGIPAGSTRAMDCEPKPGSGRMRLMVSHVYRDGWYA